MPAVTARPASLRQYQRVALDAAGDLGTVAADLEARLDEAVAGATDVPLAVPPHGERMRRLSSELAQMGDDTGRLAEAFEALDRGAGPVVTTTAVELRAELDPTLFNRALATATPILTHVGTRGFLNGYGALRLSQRGRSLLLMANHWVRREALTAVTSLRATGAMLWRFATLRWWSMHEAARRIERRAAPRLAAHSRQVADARDVFVNGRGVLRTVGRVATPVAIAADGHTLASGSHYDGVRGGVDYGMAGVGFASGTAAVGVWALTATGVIAGAPVVLTVAAVGATAAAVWGVGNFGWDHREALGDGIRSAANWTGEKVSNAASAVADTTRNVASSVTDGVSDAASAVSDGVSQGFRSVGTALGFGG